MNKLLYDSFQRFSFKLSRSVEREGFSLILLAVVNMDESPEYWDMIAAVDGGEVNETVTNHIEELLISSFIDFFRSEEEKIHISKFSVLTKDEGLFTDIERILEIQGNPRELFNVELDSSIARNVVVIKSPVSKLKTFMRWTELIELGASFNQLPSHLKNQLLFEELMEVRMLFDQLPHRLKNELSFAEFTQKYLIFQKTGHLTPHRDESSFLLDSKPLNKQEEYDDD